MIIPKYIRNIHSLYINSYFESGRYKVLYTNNQFFLLDNLGYINSVLTVIKPLIDYVDHSLTLNVYS